MNGDVEKLAKGDAGEVEVRGVTAQDEDATSGCQRVLEMLNSGFADDEGARRQSGDQPSTRWQRVFSHMKTRSSRKHTNSGFEYIGARSPAGNTLALGPVKI